MTLLHERDNVNNFENELRGLINKYSEENKSNTPDFILSQYVEGCLLAFNTAVQQRETWYGRNAQPSFVIDAMGDIAMTLRGKENGMV